VGYGVPATSGAAGAEASIVGSLALSGWVGATSLPLRLHVLHEPGFLPGSAASDFEDAKSSVHWNDDWADDDVGELLMLGSAAIQRINQAIGFRPAGNPLETAIAAALQEAQDDLEMGKTLPRFLLLEDQTLLLTTGNHTVPIPTGFARSDDERPISFVPAGSTKMTFLQEKRIYKDAVQAYAMSDFATTGFKVYVLRNSVIDFIVSATSDTTFTWNYYKYADAFATNAENAWLAHKTAKWWLIGEAGYRIALDLKDQTAMATFDQMRQKGRAATFGDLLAKEDESGPLVMGANL
jgi:hypothetical protein